MTKIRYNIEFSLSAKQDLRWLRNRMEANITAEGAKLRILDILKRIEILKTFPYIGPKENSLEILGQGHRYLIKGFLKIIYKID